MAIAARLDILLHSAFIKDAAIIAFIVNELVSLIENAGLMGVPFPEPLLNAIDILKSKTKEPPKE